MRSFFSVIAVVASTISCSFSILAANDEPIAAESPSEQSSSRSGEKPSVTSDAEGFSPNGVIDDPDGYVNLRKEKNADSPIIAKVKKDEPFEYRCTQNATWCKVKLASGLTGWMHYSRIKRYYTEKDLPKGPEDSGEEIDEQTRKQGVNYYEVARTAARGDKKALRTFLTLGLDGAAEETYITSILPVVIPSRWGRCVGRVFAEPAAQLPVHGEKQTRRQRNLSISKPGISPTPLSENLQTIFPARDRFPFTRRPLHNSQGLFR